MNAALSATKMPTPAIGSSRNIWSMFRGVISRGICSIALTASPFGISPTGFAGLYRPGADLTLAEAAASANLPFIMSGTSTASLEAAASIAPSHTWYQLYVAQDLKISEDQIRRARDAGLSTLVLTVDVPVSSKRERNIRNNFGLTFKPDWRAVLDGFMHVPWVIEYFRKGMPAFENWSAYAGNGADPLTVAQFVTEQTPATVTWRDLENFRAAVAAPSCRQGPDVRR